MNYNKSQIELYLGYIEVSFFMLSNVFHGVFAYNEKQAQHQSKYHDGYESSMKYSTWDDLDRKSRFQKI